MCEIPIVLGMTISEIRICSGLRGGKGYYKCYMCDKDIGDCDYVMIEFSFGDNRIIVRAHLHCVPVCVDKDVIGLLSVF